MDQQEDNLTLQENRIKLLDKGSTFAPANREDIIGIDPILDLLEPIIAWMSNSGSLANSRLQPGLLFEGSPGTGKTLCSRYIATRTGARFINVRDWPTAGDFLTAKDIKDLFSMSRDSYQKDGRPVIIFWDEFESHARERGAISAREATVVSQLTAELDGVNGKTPGVLFIGCTNYKEIIDHALLRPGRMGIHINFIPPDREGKQKLLNHYLSKFNLEDDIDYESASLFFEDKDTAAFIEESVSKVWLTANIESLRTNQEPLITNKLIYSVFLENLLGPPAPFLQVRDNTEFHVAVHELGHALIARTEGIPIRVITIRAGARYLGRTFTSSIDEKVRTIKDSISMIRVCLGSIYAERMLDLPNLINSESDIYNANSIAHKLTGTLGVKTQPGGIEHIDLFSYDVKYRSAPDTMSEGVKTMFDRRLLEVIGESETNVQRVLAQIGRDKIATLAHRLVEDKTWTGKEFERIAEDIIG